MATKPKTNQTVIRGDLCNLPKNIHFTRYEKKDVSSVIPFEEMTKKKKNSSVETIKKLEQIMTESINKQRLH